jgi:hypothetical protein
MASKSTKRKGPGGGRPQPSGRVTPKGGARQASPKRSGPHHADEASSRYTPPIPRSAKTSPTWVPFVMFGLLILGMLLIFLNYIDVMPGGVSYIWLGLGLLSILGGIIAATQYR